MLTSYLFPISYAFLTFPIAALLFTLPFLIVQYSKHGYINKLRAVLLYLFLLYMMNAFFLVILPLPESRHNTPVDIASFIQLVPFTFIEDITRETGVVLDQPSTYYLLLKEHAFMQAVFNILLTIPFGIFLRYYFRTGWFKCLLASFGLSLFYEVTQLTGIYGFYDYPYRLFDVDDLLLNTLGGMIGFIIAEWLSALLPRIDRLDDQLDLSQKRVSYTRRGVAFMLDWLLLFPVLIFMRSSGLPNVYFLIAVLYFIVIPWLTNGRTVGKLIVRIRITGAGERLKLKEMVIRNGLLYVILGGLNVLFLSTGFRLSSNILSALLSMGLFVMDGWFFIHVLIRLFNRDKQLLHETKSHTSHKIT